MLVPAVFLKSPSPPFPRTSSWLSGRILTACPPMFVFSSLPLSSSNHVCLASHDSRLVRSKLGRTQKYALAARNPSELTRVNRPSASAVYSADRETQRCSHDKRHLRVLLGENQYVRSSEQRGSESNAGVREVCQETLLGGTNLDGRVYRSHVERIRKTTLRHDLAPRWNTSTQTPRSSWKPSL